MGDVPDESQNQNHFECHMWERSPHLQSMHPSVQLPVTIGHELSGEIVALGKRLHQIQYWSGSHHRARNYLWKMPGLPCWRLWIL